MNVFEMIIWMFSLSIAIGGAIIGYARAGAVGCAAGFVAGLVLGLLLAVAASRAGGVISQRQRAQGRRKSAKNPAKAGSCSAACWIKQEEATAEQLVEKLFGTLAEKLNSQAKLAALPTDDSTGTAYWLSVVYQQQIDAANKQARDDAGLPDVRLLYLRLSAASQLAMSGGPAWPRGSSCEQRADSHHDSAVRRCGFCSGGRVRGSRHTSSFIAE